MISRLGSHVFFFLFYFSDEERMFLEHGCTPGYCSVSWNCKRYNKSYQLSRVLSRESYESPSKRSNKKEHNTSRSTIISKNLASVKCKVFSWIFICPVWRLFSLTSLLFACKIWKPWSVDISPLCIRAIDVLCRRSLVSHSWLRSQEKLSFPLQVFRLNWDYKIKVQNPWPDSSSFYFDRRTVSVQGKGGRIT